MDDPCRSALTVRFASAASPIDSNPGDRANYNDEHMDARHNALSPFRRLFSHSVSSSVFSDDYCPPGQSRQTVCFDVRCLPCRLHSRRAVILHHHAGQSVLSSPPARYCLYLHLARPRPSSQRRTSPAMTAPSKQAQLSLVSTDHWCGRHSALQIGLQSSRWRGGRRRSSR